MGQTFTVGKGEAAFYGPKIDFQVRDAHRREFTNSTVQVDFQLPQRFDLEYVADDGTRKRPVMVHRGAAGSMERLFSYMIERYAGAFPTWLHPTQVVVASTKDEFNDYAKAVGDRLRAARVRVDVDTRSERLNRKIRDARLKKVPYIAVVGEKEAAAGDVNVNDRTDKQIQMPLDQFVAMITAEIAERRR
jgi:threonyl-tRNA synthetase